MGETQETISRDADIPDGLEQQFVWKFFEGRREGFFVEVGAAEPHGSSQTWLLERNGWRGNLVEPQAGLAENLRRQRKNSLVWQVACSSPEKQGEAFLHIPHGELYGFAALEKNVDDLGIVYGRSEKVRVVALDHILAEAGNPTVDFVSIDVEGTELDVLTGFDLVRHRPRLLLIEDKVISLKKHCYLTRRGYKLVKRTWLNNWYIPESDSFELTGGLERLELFRKTYLGLPIRKFRHYLRRLRAERR